MAERKIKNFNDEIGIEEIASYSSLSDRSLKDRELIEKIAEKSQFSSRGDHKKKLRKRTPYVIQKNIKMRLGMPDLLNDLSLFIGSNSDQETLEKAILALIEKINNEELKKQYLNLVS